MKKSWYVVKSVAGIIGAVGSTSRIQENLTKKEATKICSSMKKKNENKFAVYWIDFDWKI